MSNLGDKKSSLKPKVSNHELLYQLSIAQREKKSIEIKQREYQKQREELSQCTFRPDLSSSREDYINYSSRTTQNFYQRNISWKQQRDSVIKKERKKLKGDAMQECTFHPNTQKSNISYQFHQRELSKDKSNL